MTKEVTPCRALTTEAVRIVNLSRGLSHSWGTFEQYFRDEHLNYISGHAHEMWIKDQIDDDAYNSFTALVGEFLDYNRGNEDIPNKNILYEQALDLAINAIHNCVEKIK